jgi:ribonuclease HII
MELDNITSFDLPELLQTLNQDSYLAGVDEVGRGALFGPVVAAAVVAPLSALTQLSSLGVKDSKKLSAQRRGGLAAKIRASGFVYQLGYASAKRIDEVNILQATLEAMKRSLVMLKIKPTICLVDGNHLIPNLGLRQYSIIKGDERSPVIAAASIIAKVWRDELIERWAVKYPQYDLISNKGYGTKKHLEAIKKYGVSPQHRLSFAPCQMMDNCSPLTLTNSESFNAQWR